MEEKPSYYAIIPADVRYDENLKMSEKMMYGEITCLSSKTGECWASNNYFAKLYNVTPQAISKWIKNLENNHYISVSYEKEDKVIKKRIIKMVSTTIDRVSTDVNGVINYSLGGYQHTIKENNININNISNNKYIYMGTYKRIKLTKEQYNKLIDDYGEDYINQIIMRLDEYVESNNNKNKYSNYNLVIRKAIRDNWFKIEKLPSWFNQETATKKATTEEQQQIEDLLKMYR